MLQKLNLIFLSPVKVRRFLKLTIITPIAESLLTRILPVKHRLQGLVPETKILPMKNQNKPINMKSGLYFFIAALFFLTNSCKSQSENKEITDLSNCIRVIDNISYGTGESKSWKLDMAIPLDSVDGLLPAIVIVHGGGWNAGSKQAPVYRALLMDYALQGYITVSVEYRFINEASFPACIQDVKCAVRWLKAHSEEYNVDTNRIGIFGHSAGAHLAMMVAMSSSNKELEGDGGWNNHTSNVASLVAASTPTQVVPRFSNVKEYWPVNYINTKLIPTFIIHGTKDEIVPVEPVDVFVDSLKMAGAKDLNYLRVEGGNHGVAYEFNLDVTRPAMDAFFKRTLKRNK